MATRLMPDKFRSALTPVEEFEKFLRQDLAYKVDAVKYMSVVGRCSIDDNDLEGWFMPYKAIYQTAKHFNVIPEFFVDEEFYYQRQRMLVYRIAFAVLDKGFDLWDLYLKVKKYIALTSYTATVAGMTRGVTKISLETLQKVLDVVGLEPAQIFITGLRKEVTETYDAMRAIIQHLDDKDMAALTALALALARAKVLDPESLRRDLERIFEWLAIVT